MIGFSFTVMIINSAVDNFWPDISGEINPVNFYILYIVFFKKEQLLWLAMFLMQDNCSLHQHDVIDSPIRAAYRAGD